MHTELWPETLKEILWKPRGNEDNIKIVLK
jgi:hypothetical protein